MWEAGHAVKFCLLWAQLSPVILPNYNKGCPSFTGFAKLGMVLLISGDLSSLFVLVQNKTLAEQVCGSLSDGTQHSRTDRRSVKLSQLASVRLLRNHASFPALVLCK
jgi:hypothetical protein